MWRLAAPCDAQPAWGRLLAPSPSHPLTHSLSHPLIHPLTLPPCSPLSPLSPSHPRADSATHPAGSSRLLHPAPAAWALVVAAQLRVLAAVGHVQAAHVLLAARGVVRVPVPQDAGMGQAPGGGTKRCMSTQGPLRACMREGSKPCVDASPACLEARCAWPLACRAMPPCAACVRARDQIRSDQIRAHGPTARLPPAR